jgi:hypothetical protein
MSICPICKGRDGFPQTIQKEKVTTSGFYVSSRTESNQFVFCKECRVQFEPLTTWAAYEQREQQRAINKMSPSEKMLHQTPSLMRDLKQKRKSSWALTTVMLILIVMCGFLVFSVEEFSRFRTEFILITGGYFVLFILYLRRNKRKMSDLIEMENRARRELGR